MLSEIIDYNAVINRRLTNDQELLKKIEEVAYYEKQLDQFLGMLPPERLHIAEKIILIMSNMDFAKNAVNYYVGYRDALQQSEQTHE